MHGWDQRGIASVRIPPPARSPPPPPSLHLSGHHRDPLLFRSVAHCDKVGQVTVPPKMASLTSAPRSREHERKPETAFPFMSRREIEGLIASGKHVIIVNQFVLRVDPWLKYHPGGDIAIKHMVGRDATDEVNAYVQPGMHPTIGPSCFVTTNMQGDWRRRLSGRGS